MRGNNSWEEKTEWLLGQALTELKELENRREELDRSIATLKSEITGKRGTDR